jgi:hypothetical protein
LRFTIKSLMIAVVIAAVLLALLRVWAVIAIPLAIPVLAQIGANRLVFQRRRSLVARVFWGAAILINVLYAALCVAPDYYVLHILFVTWLLIAVPTIGPLGMAWAELSTQESSVPRRSQAAIGFSILLLNVLPIITLWTLWPLRLGLLVARPSLETLADQVAAGQTVGFPHQAGLFRVAGSAIDPATGDIGLLIDPSPSGYGGFVRGPSGAPPGKGGPIIGTELDVYLGWGWSYRQDD